MCRDGGATKSTAIFWRKSTHFTTTTKCWCYEEKDGCQNCKWRFCLNYDTQWKLLFYLGQFFGITISILTLFNNCQLRDVMAICTERINMHLTLTNFLVKSSGCHSHHHSINVPTSRFYALRQSHWRRSISTISDNAQYTCSKLRILLPRKITFRKKMRANILARTCPIPDIDRTRQVK